MSKYFVHTLGCKANYADSVEIEHQFVQKGWQPSHQALDADVIVINSCAVTDEAQKQTKKLADTFKKKNPKASIVLTGCVAEVSSQELLKLSSVSYVIGNQDKHRFSDLLDQAAPEQPVLGSVQNVDAFLSRHPEDREWPALTDGFFFHQKALSASPFLRTRAFLKIQEGCNAFCTYCIIPYARGPSRSLSIEHIVEKIQSLVDQGYLEVVLTGTNIGEYGVDFAGVRRLDDLVESILAKTKLIRLRLSSLDPTEITSRLIAMMKSEPRLCSHFHVSLQSPMSSILKLMKRNYRTEHVQHTLEQIATIADVFVGMDVITGFPLETDACFEEGMALLKQLPWTRLHVFPYSERANTPATRLRGSVPKEVRSQRAKQLKKLSMQRQLQSYQERLGQNSYLEDVLLEKMIKSSQGSSSGLSSGYFRVVFFNDVQAYLGTLQKVHLKDIIVDTIRQEVAFVGSVVMA